MTTATASPAVIEQRTSPRPHFVVTLAGRPSINLYPHDPGTWYADSRSRKGVQYRIESPTGFGWDCHCPARIRECAHILALMALFDQWGQPDMRAPETDDWNDSAPVRASEKEAPLNAPESPTALTVVGRDIATRREGDLATQLHDPAKQEVLWNHLAPGLFPLERQLFVEVCTNTGLNPFMKQIYAIPRGNGDKRKVTHQVSIDGFRLIAHRTGLHAGTDDAVFEEDGNGKVKKATVTVWKLVGGQRFPFTASALFKEYAVDADKSWSQWAIRPHTMTAKCAESLALRKAFPAEMAGLYTEDEMAQADNPRELRLRADLDEPSGDGAIDAYEAEQHAERAERARASKPRYPWSADFKVALDESPFSIDDVGMFFDVPKPALGAKIDEWLNTAPPTTPRALIKVVGDWLAAGSPNQRPSRMVVTPASVGGEPEPATEPEMFDEAEWRDPSAEPATEAAL